MTLGESIPANGYLSLKVTMPFSRRLAYVLLQFFLPRTPQQLLPKRRRSGAKPLHSAAEAAPHHNRDLPKRGALFHNALTSGQNV